MTKEELKPIDVSKYKVTETGQVLKMTELEKEAEEYYEDVTVDTFQECTENFADAVLTAYKDGAEFGYNKAEEEMQEQDYSLVDFVMQYENGKFTGKEFESVDGKTWKEIVLPKLSKVGE